MGSNIRLSKSAPQSRKYYIIYTLTPSSCFSLESSRENAFFFTFPQHMGQSWGISTRRGRTSVRPATPMRRHLRLQVGVKRCRRRRAKGEGGLLPLFFFPLNESNLINITVRSLVWKQCKAKFSNHSLCHITLGTFVRGAHLAPPALTSPSTPSSHTGAHHWWSAGLIGPLNSNKIHQIINIFGKPTRS